MARLRDAHPDIDVQIAVLTSHDTLARIAQGTLDVGLVALPQTAVAGLSIRAWRRDPVMAFLPADWPLPARVTPGSAARPLILNDATTRLSRLTTEWFALGGHRPEPRIELNYNDAIKSLVAAGYGATLLPHEAGARYPMHASSCGRCARRCGVNWVSRIGRGRSSGRPSTCSMRCGR